MCDLLWADPAGVPGHTPSKRGASMCFGPDISKQFLEENNLSIFMIMQVFWSDLTKLKLRDMSRLTIREL